MAPERDSISRTLDPCTVQITSRSAGESDSMKSARDICAVFADDVVQIDRVPLRFRHLFDRTDIHVFTGRNQRSAAPIAASLDLHLSC
jgi:hypothetical protein